MDKGGDGADALGASIHEDEMHAFLQVLGSEQEVELCAAENLRQRVFCPNKTSSNVHTKQTMKRLWTPWQSHWA